MRSKIFFLIALLSFPYLAKSQTAKSWPAEVKVIESKSNDTVSAEGDLSAGKTLDDLSWAWSSANACFVSIQSHKYSGNHVLYATTIPPRSIMTIKVVPEDTNANFSLYAYSIGTNDFYVVPELPRSVTCEADHKWDRPWKGKTQDHTRWVELNAIGDPFNVVIGVAGPRGVASGKFKLEISVKQ